MENWRIQAEILGNLGQFAFGFMAVILSVIALFMKRRDVFTSELVKKQLSELDQIRQSLSEIIFDVHYVAMFKGMIEVSGQGLDWLKKECPAEWEQYQRYKKNSLSTFYKLGTPNYYLFPEWIGKEKIGELYKAMQEFAPFTVSSTGRKEHEKIEKYMNEILSFITYLDINLRKHA